jgi:hypothetical protein
MATAVETGAASADAPSKTAVIAIVAVQSTFSIGISIPFLIGAFVVPETSHTPDTE